MAYSKREFRPSTSHYKILETVSLLNKEHKFPLPEGVGKILRGEVDDETLQFKNYPTYRTLISYQSKKICRYILMLTRYGYLSKIFDRKSKELYLRITSLGEAELLEYKKKHHPKYKKRIIEKKPTIVTIEQD